MALSETQILKIAKILGIAPSLVDLQLSYFTLTAAKQTAIEAELTAWDAGPEAVTNYARLRPTESNRGVETDPDRDANSIRAAIANYFERPDWGNVSGSFEFELVR